MIPLPEPVQIQDEQPPAAPPRAPERRQPEPPPVRPKARGGARVHPKPAPPAVKTFPFQDTTKTHNLMPPPGAATR